MSHKDFVAIKVAWIIDLTTIKVLIDPHAHHESVHLIDENNVRLKVRELKRKDNEIYFHLGKKLDLTKAYRAIYHSEIFYAYYSLEMLNKYFYTGEKLGCFIDKTGLQARLWSPTAQEITFLLYDQKNEKLIGKKGLRRGAKGLWKGVFKPKDFGLSKPQHFEGCFYLYEVKAFGKKQLGLDPYAKSLACYRPPQNKHLMDSHDFADEERLGKAAIVSFEKSVKKEVPKKIIANASDFIGYEAHIHDFTCDPNLEIPENEKGSFKGFEKIIDKIKELGVTHIQFMPLMNFASVDESNRDFQHIDIPKDRVNYNWGYDSHHFFSPEGWYATDAHEPKCRVLELQSLIGKVHHEGMGAILDVVYNHLYHKSFLENVAPGCYLRHHEDGRISEGTGAGVTFESRCLMARRLILDSLKWWQDFYGFDGFRFDLMGFLDHDTMKAIRKHLKPSTILYGEAWNFTDLPFPEATTKINFPKEAKLSVFNDCSRDSYTGQMSAKGFIQGQFHEVVRVKTGIIGALKDFPAPYGEMLDDGYHRFAREPWECLNYLAIHDGFTLWDKMNLSVGGSREERERLVRMAFGMLLTSQGRVVIHGGDEVGRSKPLSPNDPNPDRAHTTNQVFAENCIRHFHENSYASPDAVNHLDWRRAKNFKQLKDYVAGLISLRRALPCLRYEKAKNVAKGLSFLGHPENLMLETPGDSAGFTSFSDPRLKKMKIRFINAPKMMRGKQYFLAGELHPKGKDKNPVDNPFTVFFNNEGRGELTLNRSDILEFDFGAWNAGADLHIKLVATPGQWDVPYGIYEGLGSHSLSPYGILKGGIVVFDLSIPNHHAGHIPRYPQCFVAYLLDNSLEKAHAPKVKLLPYKQVIVVHNADDKELTLFVPEIKTTTKWHVLADDKVSGVKALVRTEVQLRKGVVVIPRKCTVIIGGLE